MSGPNVGPRNGARMYGTPTRPASFVSHMSERVPAATPKMPEPPRPAKNRNRTRTTKLSEAAAMALKMTSMGKLVQ